MSLIKFIHELEGVQKKLCLLAKMLWRSCSEAVTSMATFLHSCIRQGVNFPGEGGHYFIVRKTGRATHIGGSFHPKFPAHRSVLKLNSGIWVTSLEFSYFSYQWDP